MVLSNCRIWVFLGKCPSNEKHLFLHNVVEDFNDLLNWDDCFIVSGI